MYGALRALFLNTNYHELSMNYFMNFFVNAYSFRQFQIAVYPLSFFTVPYNTYRNKWRARQSLLFGI